MNIELNLENKAKFFAQYWLQEILIDNIGKKRFVAIDVAAGWCGMDKSFLELKPYGCTDIQGFKFYTYSSVDYLRSKGYAMPWMGLSVDDMVKAGWIKLMEG